MLRLLSSLPTVRSLTKKVNSSQPSDEFKPVYRFQQIAAGSLISKCKKLNLYAAGSLIPASYGAFALSYCDSDIPLVVTTVGVASTFAVFSIGQMFYRMIGAIYISNDKQNVKLAYVDFWGDRKDVIIPAGDFLPLSHSPKHISNILYNKIYILSSAKPYKLALKFGEILDHNAIREVFR